MTEHRSIAFVDLKAQLAAYRNEFDAAIEGVLSHGQFIMGPEVARFEAGLAAGFAGARHAVSCSSGTDALLMIMLAEGIGPGDAVFVPAFTFTATAEVPLLIGASPVFVDVDADSFNIDPDDLERRIGAVAAEGRLRPRGVLATDLFGLPADYDAIGRVAEAHDLTVWADAAQSFGARVGAARVGTLARATATSFFPAKPLGCYGDGGAVLTDDDSLAETFRSIRAHGAGSAKYDIVRIGLNARMDTLQAAILSVKLGHFAEELTVRERVAQTYDSVLKGHVHVPARYQDRTSAWAQYTVKLPADRRDAVAEELKAAGVPTAVYYPRPMHLQTAFRAHGGGEGSMPVSERLCGEVLSLPMHPFLDDATTMHIAEAVKAAV